MLFANSQQSLRPESSVHLYHTVQNLGQGYAGTETGLDGLTIYIPTSASILQVGVPAPYAGSPGYWDSAAAPGLILSLGGAVDTSQNLLAPAGYQAFIFWGMNTQSVYQQGSTASFSITLGNVEVGANTIGLTSYYGYATPPAGQQYMSNPYGNYTTFTTTAASAVAVVPEPETYALLLAGLATLGVTARRRRAR